MNTNTITSTNPAINAFIEKFTAYYDQIGEFLSEYNEQYDKISALAAKANALYNKGERYFAVQSSDYTDEWWSNNDNGEDEGWALTLYCYADGNIHLSLANIGFTREIEFDGKLDTDTFAARAAGDDADFKQLSAAKAVQELFGSLMEGFFNELQECIERGDKVLPCHLKEMMGR